MAKNIYRIGRNTGHFGRFLDEHLDSLRARKFSPTSVRRYASALPPFFIFLAEEKVGDLRDVTLDMLNRYRAWLADTGYSPNSIRVNLRVVRQMFRRLEKEGVIFDNVALSLEQPKKERKMGTVLDEDEMRRLLAAPDISRPCGLRDRAMLELLYATGIRREEMVGLSIFDLDLISDTVRVIGKGRKERCLPIGKHASKWLELYLKHGRPKFTGMLQPKSDALWFGIFKKPMTLSAPTYVVKHNARKAGITKITGCHAIRRSCATHMLRHGAHPLMVAEMLGHSNLQSLSYYLQVSAVDIKKTHEQSKVGK
jgi:integrase/recombinase XerD